MSEMFYAELLFSAVFFFFFKKKKKDHDHQVDYKKKWFLIKCLVNLEV